MFRVLRRNELDVLSPLLDLARSKSGADREEWLDDLRNDAPVVVARIELLLAAERSASSPIALQVAPVAVSREANPSPRTQPLPA